MSLAAQSNKKHQALITDSHQHHPSLLTNHPNSLKKFLSSEAGAIVLWAVTSLVAAAVIAPWFYVWGNQLAAACNERDLPALIEWLGAACGRAKLGRFYSRAMLLSALILLPFLIHRIRTLSKSSGATRIIELEKLCPKTTITHLMASFALASGILWATGIALVYAGAFVAETSQVKGLKLLTDCALPAIGASLVEEWLFRGLLLGLWLRAARPVSACIWSSLLFSFLHFLKPPVEISDPSHPLAGFDLLRHILRHFTQPQFFVTDFLTLAVIGMILCWARLRTRSLWFPIGLHAGWVFSFTAFNLLYNYSDHPLHPWGIGTNLRSGIIPILGLGLTAVACHFFLKWLEQRKRQHLA